MHRDTQLLHAGYPDHRTPGPYRPGPQFSATYVAPGDPAQHPLTYGRFHNPTWTAWEDALTSLEGGPAVAFASGMAATAAVFGALLSPGDTLVLPSDCYYTTRMLARDWLERIGVRVVLAPTRDNAQTRLVAGARLVWLETPSNPELEICDIAEITAAAHRHGALVAVDNTTATGYLQEPLGLGADLAVASDTKALTGHSDITLGHVAVRDPDLAGRLRTWRTQQGAIPGPMEVWLAHRSLATLPLRLRKQSQSAQAIAAWLTQRSEVVRVCYPGLATHPGHATARRQMKGYGPVLSFDVGTQRMAEHLLERLSLFREATSFGGVHSSAERRARWGGDAVGPGFIRMSVGCEDLNDLLADLAHGLESSGS